jgi:hypothetical protein
MQATLIRFGPELFSELKAEARSNGVSVAQYVREAVVARMAYTAGLRGDPSYRLSRVVDGAPEHVRTAAGRVRADSVRVRAESSAVRAESSQAKDQSRRVSERAGRPPRPPR